jgi:hypothetical protein
LLFAHAIWRDLIHDNTFGVGSKFLDQSGLLQLLVALARASSDMTSHLFSPTKAQSLKLATIPRPTLRKNQIL